MRSITLLLTFSIATATLAADTNTLALKAIRGDATAVRALRAMGQPGVDALMAVRAKAAPQPFARAVDAVCRQRDCAWSGLYWYTDLDAAKRAAQQSRKPILSLRLLGKLDDELSCANSRYFRTLLYANGEVSKYLRANYILHWQSERPAPLIDIDFGDGRKLRRTVTGNSIHYVLSPTGQPLDAIPGLYQPPAFLSLLREGVALHRLVDRMGDARAKTDALRAYHYNAYYVLAKPSRWAIAPLSPANEVRRSRDDRLAAWAAGSFAPSKSGGEGPVLDRVSFDARAFGMVADLAAMLKSKTVGPATIDEHSRSLIQVKRAAAPVASMRSAKSLEALLENLERTLEADTRINEQKFHAQIHRWFAVGEVTTVDAMNDRAYDELFLTPRDDAWMGLVSDTSFTGIEGEGLTIAAR
ncbi:MAG TPA: hypothetical protein VEK79_19905 [Thermoanaerobaculia bacterium]|nr:hypothetical protein [Thermoanaerobaculia bacterium]